MKSSIQDEFVRNVQGNKINDIKKLIGTGININQPDSYKRYALCLAVQEGHEEMTKLLIESGASMEVSQYGWKPISLAAHHGQLDILNYLVEKGASIHERRNGMTLLMDAIANIHTDQSVKANMCKLLLEMGVETNHLYAEKDIIDMVVRRNMHELVLLFHDYIDKFDDERQRKLEKIRVRAALHKNLTLKETMELDGGLGI